MTTCYIVYPGLGKSTLAGKDGRFADLESRIFKDLAYVSYIGTGEYPCVRGTAIETVNPDWPENYVSYAREQLAAGKILLLVPKPDNYDLIKHLNIEDYAWVLPDESRIKQLRADQLTRGDNSDYINRNLGERYSAVLDLANKSGKPVLFLKSGEYLSDAV